MMTCSKQVIPAHVPLLPERHKLAMTCQPEKLTSSQRHVYSAEQQHWFASDYLLTQLDQTSM